MKPFADRARELDSEIAFLPPGEQQEKVSCMAVKLTHDLRVASQPTVAEAKLRDAIDEIKQSQGSREISVAITYAETALLWLQSAPRK